jgi:hypothetical protein
MLVREVAPIARDVSGISEYRLDSIPGGTRLTKTSALPEGPVFGRTLLRLMTPLFGRIMKQVFVDFKREIEGDYQQHRGAPGEAVEISEEQVRAAAAAGLEAASAQKDL